MATEFKATFGNSDVYRKDDFEVHETELFVKGITKPLTVHVYSDIHLSYTDRRDDIGRRNFVMQRRIFFPGAPDVMLQAVTFNQKNEHDFTVFGGDIIDFPSESNLEALEVLSEEGFGPYLYHLGNHDDNFPREKATPEEKAAYRAKIDAFALDKTGKFKDITPEISKRENQGFHAVDLGEIIIAGGDDVTPAGIRAVWNGLEALKGINKPIILCLHLTFHSETLDPDVVKVWRSSNSMKNVDDYLAYNDNIVALFTGDIHFFSNCLAGGKIPQIVTTSTENKFSGPEYGQWPFYYSGMSIVKIKPME